MKIRIVKNDPIDDLASDITNLIGQVFEAEEIDEEGHVDIFVKGEEFTIFKGEYETIHEEIYEINNVEYSYNELMDIIEKASMYDQLCK